jgi:hypothetical protein
MRRHEEHSRTDMQVLCAHDEAAGEHDGSSRSGAARRVRVQRVLQRGAVLLAMRSREKREKNAASTGQRLVRVSWQRATTEQCNGEVS